MLCYPKWRIWIQIGRDLKSTIGQIKLSPMLSLKLSRKWIRLKTEALEMHQWGRRARKDPLPRTRVSILLDLEYHQASVDNQQEKAKGTLYETQQPTHLKILLRKAILSEQILTMAEEGIPQNNPQRKWLSHQCYLPQGDKRSREHSNRTQST